MEWYYAKDGNQQGPITMAQLRQLASSGKLDPTDMVFKTGMKDWVEASTVAGLFAAARSAAAAPAADEGGFAFGEEKAAVAPARRKGARARVEKEEVEEDEEAPRARPRRSGGVSFFDYLIFRGAIAPWAVPILFWLLVLYTVGQSGYYLIQLIGNIGRMGSVGVFAIVALLLLTAASLLFLRLLCEVILVLFRIHETLVEAKDELKRQNLK